MSTSNQIFASLGVGAAQINTQLHTPTLAPGDMLSGVVEIRGGKVAQTIDELRLTIETTYKREQDDTAVWLSCVLAEQRLSDRLVVRPGEIKTLRFALPLPLTTPVTAGGQQVQLYTSASVPNALDPRDSDPLHVQPHPTIQRVLDALATLGFQLHRVECVQSRLARGGVPFVQEWEFRPGAGYRREIEELEVVFSLQPGGLTVLLEVDRRGRGWSGMLADAYDLNERRTQLQLGHMPIDQRMLVRQLDETIRHALAPARIQL